MMVQQSIKYIKLRRELRIATNNIFILQLQQTHTRIHNNQWKLYMHLIICNTQNDAEPQQVIIIFTTNSLRVNPHMQHTHAIRCDACEVQFHLRE